VALILCFHNDGSGSDAAANYNVEVLIGDGTARGSRTLIRGRVEGHDRADGWERLVLQFLMHSISNPEERTRR